MANFVNSDKTKNFPLPEKFYSPVDNPLYIDAEFTGITQNKEIDETYIINYDNKKLKVLYVVKGRFNQVFMQEVK